MAGIAITRRDLTATELRAAAGRSKDVRAARRMLAIALVLEGVHRTTAAQTCGMDRQTLRGEEGRKTVRGNVFPPNRPRTNAEGLRAGEPDGAAPPPAAGTRAAGRACGLRSRPVLTRCGTAWCAGVAVTCSTASRRNSASCCTSAAQAKQLAALGFRRLSLRPQHPKSDPEAQEAFKKTSARRVRRRCRRGHGTSRLKSGSKSESGQKGEYTRRDVIYSRRSRRILGKWQAGGKGSFLVCGTSEIPFHLFRSVFHVSTRSRICLTMTESPDRL